MKLLPKDLFKDKNCMEILKILQIKFVLIFNIQLNKLEIKKVYGNKTLKSQVIYQKRILKNKMKIIKKSKNGSKKVKEKMRKVIIKDKKT